MNLLLLLLLQDYFKNMHTAKTTQNKENQWDGGNKQSNLWISRSASPLASSKNRGRNHEAEARKALEVHRRQERTQRELESANAKLWLAEHFKQS